MASSFSSTATFGSASSRASFALLQAQDDGRDVEVAAEVHKRERVASRCRLGTAPCVTESMPSDGLRIAGGVDAAP